jgi:NADH:quinone reductase (non-electrogenic)
MKRPNTQPIEGFGSPSATAVAYPAENSQALRAASGKSEGDAPIINGAIANPHRIVVVGGGIAGLEIASKLPTTAGKIGVAVTLVDREPAYVWKPMLHTIAAGTSDVSQQETHYIAQARDRHFIFEPGEINGIHRETRRVHLGSLTIAGRLILPKRTIPL